MAYTYREPARGGALLAALAAFALSGPAAAGPSVPSDGSDGAFTPTSSIEVDLSQAVTGTWSDSNAAHAGKGIYDPVQWAVVFKYTQVNIPIGAVVTFKNHPSGAPVVWLVQNDAWIGGQINLDGKSGGSASSLVESGPGGFKGGAGASVVHAVGSGQGPGGGGQAGTGTFRAVGGSYGSPGSDLGGGKIGPVYGNPTIVPLIGGSGGTGAGNISYDGGGGGGAFLLFAGGNLNLVGGIYARGGEGFAISSGGGAGGAIRIIADSLSGYGTLQAAGATTQAQGGAGRIRVEYNTSSYTGYVEPAASISTLGGTEPILWAPASAPSVSIAQIAGAPAPDDPYSSVGSPGHHAAIDVPTTTPVTIRINARNVPLNWNVVLRVVPYYGKDTTVAATLVSGDAAASVWEANTTFGQGVAALQARASKP